MRITYLASAAVADALIAVPGSGVPDEVVGGALRPAGTPEKVVARLARGAVVGSQGAREAGRLALVAGVGLRVLVVARLALRDALVVKEERLGGCRVAGRTNERGDVAGEAGWVTIGAEVAELVQTSAAGGDAGALLQEVEGAHVTCHAGRAD